MIVAPAERMTYTVTSVECRPRERRGRPDCKQQEVSSLSTNAVAKNLGVVGSCREDGWGRRGVGVATTSFRRHKVLIGSPKLDLVGIRE